MPTIRLRILGDSNATAGLITVLHGIDGIDRVEEVADLMPHMDDCDSSSAGLSDDHGPGLHALEIDAADPVQAERVRRVAAEAAELFASTIEFVDEF